MENNLEQMIKHCEDICELLTDYEISDITEESRVTETFRFGLIKFGIYISDVDGVVTDEELACIKENLGSCPDASEIAELKAREKLNVKEYGSEIPLILKYSVLADAKKLIKDDPYRNQKGQIITDTYRLFGQTMMACQADPSEKAARKMTVFLERMDNFLTEFGVKCTNAERLYPVKSVVNKTAECNPEELEKLLESFNSLVGLDAVKKEVNSLVNLLKVQKMREAKNMKFSDVSKHMVFSGNPGTGKTTVARTLADIYRNLGVLSKGQLIEVDRSGLVKGYIGQTAIKVQEVVESALGGILFIDEAYSLTVGKGEGDFGQEAVDTLLKAMEDNRDNLIVIVAGYPDLMDEFLSSNPGLKSRFNKFIMFDDYTPEQLLKILESQCKKQDYKLSEDARKCAFEFFTKRCEAQIENFANARDVRNYLEKAISNHATRVVTVENATEECLSTIELADVEIIEL